MGNILDKIKNMKGAKFVSIRGYENSKGEVSNQTILTGVNYGNVVNKDIQKLENAHFTNKKMEQVRVEMLNSMLANKKGGKEQSNQSKAQQDAYYNVCEGVKFHIESGTFVIQGYSISKKVLVPIEYGTTNSSETTILKRKVQKELNLMSAKYRQFKLSNMNEVAMEGNTFAINFDGGVYTTKDKAEEKKVTIKITIEYNL